MAEVDPIWEAKQKSGIIQQVDDRKEWPKVEAVSVEVEVEGEDKPRRGRPPKAVDAD